MAKKLAKRILWLVVLAAVAVLAVRGLREGLYRLDLARYPLKYTEYVENEAVANGVDPLLLYSIIRTESGFDPNAESSVGARGLMQITEVTFDWIKSKIAKNEPVTFDDLYDPAVNIRFGAYYFAACLARYHGDVSTAAAAYHSGWGTVDGLLEKAEYSASGETLHTFPYEQMGLYVTKINRAYERYRALYGA